MASSFTHFILLLPLFVFPSFSNAFSLPNPFGNSFDLERDPSTLQYMIKINQGTPQAEVKLVIDLGGKLPWFGCRKGYNSSSYRPASCMSPQCSQASKPVKIQQHDVGKGDLISDLMAVTYNFNPEVSPTVTSLRRFAFGCAASSNFFTGLPKASKGVAGLGRSSALSLVPQISVAFRLSRIFALELFDGSGNDQGEIFDGNIYFGGGPYIHYDWGYGDWANRVLTYTPLLINPKSREEYFVDLKSIKVHGETVRINKKLLSINKKTGTGGTKSDIQTPCTTLETSIYKAFIKVHTAWAEHLNNANAEFNDNLNITAVAPVAPFTSCYNSSTMSRVLSWLNNMPPSVAFIFPKSAMNISLFDLVRSKDGVDCVGFIDGGSKPMTSIVIGARQAGFLEFDISRSRLGFVEPNLKNF
ncbi:hypothetical protein MKW98_015726 [Papaver atlanticum]|uniref:Peptidase A1 domain-containing protein n=1 Tax=Papaver atlanticum TaxID=357466 RepID=A0AAD4XHI9_9MAGN|nr:hypothetical protein MKW98_015726 [Papaver atlanticum]